MKYFISTILRLIVTSLFIHSLSYSQNPEWINYTNGNYIPCLTEEGDYIWVGTSGGLVKLNKNTGSSIFYNKLNSGLPDNSVESIAIDNSGNKWIGTWGASLAKFDGNSWTIYNTFNSGLPLNDVVSLAIDNSDNKWIGTWGEDQLSMKN